MANLGKALRTVEVLSVDESCEPAEELKQAVEGARDPSRAEGRIPAKA